MLTKAEKKYYADAIKAGLSIPRYFNMVIRPELDDYYSDYTADFDVVDVIKCPLHTEDTPSFRYYPDTMSFYCYGCGRGGDVINLHRLFIESVSGSQPEFDISVEYLYKRFIEGKQVDQVATSNALAGTSLKVEKEPLSTPSELVAFSIAVKELERGLVADQGTPLDVKIKLWRAIDLANNLVDKNFVNAMTARRWLKETQKAAITGKIPCKHSGGCEHTH